LKTWFNTEHDSHAHSLQTLNALYEYDDFMLSVKTMADMGCGREGLDLEWWATRTTRDENPRPLNIQCTGIDQLEKLTLTNKYPNLRYQNQDIESKILVTKRNRFDVVWCHNTFQYVINPFKTLSHWYDAMSNGGMLIIVVPQMTNLEFNQQCFDQPDGVYWNWTMVSLMHVLAVSGFDCAGGHFAKSPMDPWIHAAVYKSEQVPMDPRTTRWYDLVDKGLLPDSAVDSISRHGYLRQRDLVLPWLDKSLSTMSEH
jgi:SAM-dependent methyltransferase